MSTSNQSSPQWLLVAIGLIADTLGILGYLGFSANRSIQIAVMAILGLLGVAAATSQLVSSTRLSVSLRGAYYGTGALRIKIIGSAVALVLAAILVTGAVVLAVGSKHENTKSSGNSQATKQLDKKSQQP